MSCEESSDSDFDTDEVLKELESMKKMLQRHVGKHKNVARLQGRDEVHWPEVPTIQAQSSENDTDRKNTVRLVNDAEEKERTRRMSVPFSDTLTDDTDIEEVSEHVTTMQEELLHLFAIHDSKFQAECEKERRSAETAKQRMQEQLLQKASLRIVRQEFEEERQRRIEEMESFLTGDNEESMAVAEANEKLSLVHEDLKNAFRIMEKATELKEKKQVCAAEESKEVLLQEIRRKSTKYQHDRDFELARQQKMEDYNARRVTSEAEDLDRSLVKVQEDLLKLFGKLKRERKVKKEEIRVEQSNFKNLMQEELLHKTLGQQVSQLEAHEKARRITEAKGCATEEDNKRQKTMDILIDVQKQLLDVMSHTELMSTTQQMHQLKFMNARTDMLHEIRMRSSDHDVPNNAGGLASYTTGRRLSIIGENLQK